MASPGVFIHSGTLGGRFSSPAARALLATPASAAPPRMVPSRRKRRREVLAGSIVFSMIHPPETTGVETSHEFAISSRHSHLEQLGIASLDLLALRQDRRRIGLQQLDLRQWLVSRFLLDLGVKRAMRKGVDQHLLSLRTEEEALEQPGGIRVGRIPEHAGGHDDQ